MSKATLKSQNAAWIWAVVTADALTLAALAFSASLGEAVSLLAGSRIAGLAIAPVIVLLLTSLLPSDAKAVLVFWRFSDVLPGHRAFSVYANKDPRIDVERLLASVGQFPESPREQNTLWYRLFKKVDSTAEVAQAHRHFLLFRDLAALSLLLGIVAPLALYFLGAGMTAIWLAVALLGLQYLATAVAARLQGVRLVCNVLALHGAADAPKAPAHSRKSLARKGSHG